MSAVWILASVRIPFMSAGNLPAVRVLQVHDEIPYRLGHPGCGGAKHADAPGGVLDDGQDVLALSVEGDGFDEVAGQECVGL